MTQALLSEINRLKKRLVNKAKVKGVYENFGQAEVGKLKEKYSYNSLVYGTKKDRQLATYIDAFDTWCMSYDGQ
jgi:hypothetical protein